MKSDCPFEDPSHTSGSCPSCKAFTSMKPMQKLSVTLQMVYARIEPQEALKIAAK